MQFLKTITLLLVTLMSAQLSFSQQLKKNEKAVIKTHIYCDHCKECETCGKNFQSGLLKLKGVKMYELDQNYMTITVYYNAQKTNLTTIKTRITELGYDADEMKADFSSYEKLDNCCKKI